MNTFGLVKYREKLLLLNTIKLQRCVSYQTGTDLGLMDIRSAIVLSIQVNCTSCASNEHKMRVRHLFF